MRIYQTQYITRETEAQIALLTGKVIGLEEELRNIFLTGEISFF